MRRTIVYLTISVCVWLGVGMTSAATIPAGTTLVVRTLEAISSVDSPGTHFAAQLENNVAANGKVALHAGTKLTGRVVTARRSYTSTQRLTVDITSALVSGRTVPIKTTGAVQLDNTNFKTRHNVSVSRGSYQIAVGRIIRFHLAQPLQF
jgi:hypothetical protein